MIRIRDVFQIKPDRMRDAKASAKAMFGAESELGVGEVVILTDLIADFFTLVFESEYESVGDFEAAFAHATSNPEWRKHYERFRDTIVGGRREIFTVVE